jgi:Flp pilus assembly pilin Flp
MLGEVSVLTRVVRSVTGFWRDRCGAVAVQYALLMVLIAVVCIGAWNGIATSLSAIFSYIVLFL